VLTETDGPFVERSGQPLGPGEVLPVLGEIANMWGIDSETVRQRVVRSLGHLLANIADG